MSLSWETFKSALGSYWNTSCIMYVDDEGKEIPIEDDGKFQEALKLAKLNKNRLKLIFYDKSIPNSEKMSLTFPETLRVFTPENSTEAPEDTNVQSSSSDSNEKENTCCCNRDVPPEWFTHHMKKFKKALLHELRSNIIEIIKNATEKEQKHLCTNSVDLLGEKNETSAPVHPRKKKRISDKDGVDFSEQRDLKLLKKLEKLQSTKSERLEKLDHKTKLLLEERKKLLEKKRLSKSKQEKNCLSVSEKKKKSASIHGDGDNNIYLYLVPGGEFTVTVKIKNDGKLPWTSPQLECFDVTRLHPNQVSINLPQMLPNESCCATIKGKASKALGLHHFKCRVVEAQKPISSELICWARVDHFEPYEKYSNVFINEKGMVVDTADKTEKLIDIDFIASSKKKIEENIIEIEKKLKFIDLLRPTTSDEPKNAAKKGKKSLSKNPETQTESCDLLQNSEVKEKNWTKRLEEEEVLFGVDCLRLESESNEASEVKTKDENQQVESKEKIQKDCESENSSDSELSMIFMSEEDEEEDDDNDEDENFIIVPLLSKSPSPAESVHEDKNSEKFEADEKPATSQEKLEPTVVIEQPSKSITIKIHTNRPQMNKESTPDNSTANQSSPTRSRRSSFGEEIPKSKSKKMKSKSTEYYFTTANLTQPTFKATSNGFQTEKPSKFTFTSDKNEKEGVFEFTFTTDKEEKTQKNDEKGKTIRRTDASGRIIYTVNNMGRCVPFENGEPDDQGNQNRNKKGNDGFSESPSVNNMPNATGASSRVVYAVNNMGRCVPVEDFFKNGEHSRNVREESSEANDQENQNRQEKRNDRINEIPSVNILPNVLVNGASNVASIALNTAKSVINNLQSAFVTEAKTELGKPACEVKKKVLRENMFRLYEMGFPDLQINRKLLLIHDNDLSKVIEELVQLRENSSDQKFPEFLVVSIPPISLTPYAV